MPGVEWAIRTRAAPTEIVPAARLFWLLLGGASLRLEAWDALPAAIRHTLLSDGWVETDSDHVTATAALCPVGGGIAVSARLTPAPATGQTERGVSARHPNVAFPDDSAFHLMGALPRALSGDTTAWFDIGCGNGVLQLARASLATELVALDLDTAAIAAANDGAALSGVELACAVSDLFSNAPSDLVPDLVTFNAPIPAERVDMAHHAPAALRYRVSDEGAPLINRFWSEAIDRVTPDGEIICHSVVGGGVIDAERLPGRVVELIYTPEGAKLPFAVVSCRPSAPAAFYRRRVPLSAAMPHLTRRLVDAPESAPA